MSLRTAVRCQIFVALALLLTFSSAAVAQEANVPKVDVFAGYSWATPGPVFFNTSKQGASGGAASVTWNVLKWAGLTGDFQFNTTEKFHQVHFLAGPRIAARGDHFMLFAHALGGFVDLQARQGIGDWFKGVGTQVGGGLDIPITEKVSWRVIEGDYLYSRFRHQPFGMGAQKGAGVRTGLVFNIGATAPPVPVSNSCAVQPTSLMAGEPVTATSTASNFNPKHTVTYAFNSTGGKVTPKDNTAAIDTTGLAPGEYTVTCTANDAKAKQNNTASSSAKFTINEPPKHPPTISCSADKTTVKAGDPVTITAQANSPDNRPLTYDWKSSGGKVAGNNTTATLDTAGAAAGPITVTGTVSDDRGLNAQCTASVNVEVPPPPPTASKLNEIAFPNTKKPWRVDNTAKAILDDVALRLQREADAKAVVVGYADASEVTAPKGRKAKAKAGTDPALLLAEERAVNTKAYLVQEKGIDPSRIEVRTGTAGGSRAEIYLVPAGATFNVEGTQTFDESTVKPMTDRRPAAPAPKKRTAKKPAA
jgi:outer membrane protein OmpA-like peptidoglycan-associated protein